MLRYVDKRQYHKPNYIEEWLKKSKPETLGYSEEVNIKRNLHILKPNFLRKIKGSAKGVV